MLTFDRQIESLINRPSINNSLMLAGRALMAYIFIIAGWNKITGYSGTVAYMEAQGVPGSLAFLVILLELGGGLALLIGYQARFVAFFLSCFCIASGVIFHPVPEDAIGLMKNLAMAGGFLFLFTHGSGRFSIDYYLRK